MHYRMKPTSLLLYAFSAIVLCGCGKSNEAPRTVVEGTVTFQSQPIENGAITFAPIQGLNGAAVQLKIQDGKFSTATDANDKRGIVIGQNDVEIIAYKKTGKQIKDPDNNLSDEIIQFIPEKYNTKTTLRQEITAGKNELVFDLK